MCEDRRGRLIFEAYRYGKHFRLHLRIQSGEMDTELWTRSRGIPGQEKKAALEVPRVKVSTTAASTLWSTPLGYGCGVDKYRMEKPVICIAALTLTNGVLPAKLIEIG